MSEKLAELKKKGGGGSVDTITLIAVSTQNGACYAYIDKTTADSYKYFTISGDANAIVYYDSSHQSVTKGQKYLISDISYTTRIGCACTSGRLTGYFTLSKS